MGVREIPNSIFLPPPTNARERTINQAILDAYQILAQKLRVGFLVGLSSMTPDGNVFIQPDDSVVIVRKLTIAAGKKLFLGLGARLRIL